MGLTPSEELPLLWIDSSSFQQRLNAVVEMSSDYGETSSGKILACLKSLLLLRYTREVQKQILFGYLKYLCFTLSQAELSRLFIAVGKLFGEMRRRVCTQEFGPHCLEGADQTARQIIDVWKIYSALTGIYSLLVHHHSEVRTADSVAEFEGYFSTTIIEMRSIIYSLLGRYDDDFLLLVAYEIEGMTSLRHIQINNIFIEPPLRLRVEQLVGVAGSFLNKLNLSSVDYLVSAAPQNRCSLCERTFSASEQDYDFAILDHCRDLFCVTCIESRLSVTCRQCPVCGRLVDSWVSRKAFDQFKKLPRVTSRPDTVFTFPFL